MITVVPPKVKICGLRTAEDAIFAARQGAEALGFIFAPARRRVTPSEARAIIESVRSSAAISPAFVGVFVDPVIDELLDVIETSGIDRVQLHGTLNPKLIQEIPVPVVPGLGPKPGSTSIDVLREIDRYRDAAYFHVVGHDPVQHGGRGVQADWSLVRQLAEVRPIELAGGLRPDNVANAIRAVEPLGVDVSSGVETDGHKDQTLIRSFISEALRAFRILD